MLAFSRTGPDFKHLNFTSKRIILCISNFSDQSGGMKQFKGFPPRIMGRLAGWPDIIKLAKYKSQHRLMCEVSYSAACVSALGSGRIKICISAVNKHYCQPRSSPAASMNSSQHQILTLLCFILLWSLNIQCPLSCSTVKKWIFSSFWILTAI